MLLIYLRFILSFQLATKNSSVESKITAVACRNETYIIINYNPRNKVIINNLISVSMVLILRCTMQSMWQIDCKRLWASL
jgi:hypothetical protein